MRTSHCICDKKMDAYKQKVLEMHLSTKSCDACNCPVYVRDSDSGWSYYSELPIHHLTRSTRKVLIGKNKRKEKNQSTYSFFIDELAASSINGINNWAKSKRGFCKFLWLTVFMGCVIGYSYQTFTFYMRYRNNPSIVETQVENDGQVEFPAITICNANRFRKSEFCKRFEKVCELQPYENITIKESEMYDLSYELLLNNEGKVKREMSHPKEMIQACKYNGYPSLSEKECESTIDSFYDPDFGNCYTLPAKNNDGLILQAREGDFWQDNNAMNILVNVQPTENMETERQPGLYIVIHDRATMPDIHTDGLFLTPGSSYSVGVRKSTIRLLPLPYKTNCTDYIQLPWQKNWYRRMTSRLCTVGCSQYLQLNKCNFVSENLSLFYDKLPYQRSDVTEESKQCAKDEEERTLEYCRSLCGLPCKDIIFQAFTKSVPLSRKILASFSVSFPKEFYNLEKFEETMVHLRIYYSSFEHKIYEHTAKYTSMELFSYLGGYSGVWLGFSLLTVYEMLEITVTTALFAVKKYRNNRQKNKSVRTVIGSRKNAKKPGIKTSQKRKFYR